MAEKLVLVGVLPEIVVIGPEEQVVWLSDTGTLKIQFDPNRCPFQSNVFRRPRDANCKAARRVQARTQAPTSIASG